MYMHDIPSMTSFEYIFMQLSDIIASTLLSIFSPSLTDEIDLVIGVTSTGYNTEAFDRERTIHISFISMSVKYIYKGGFKLERFHSRNQQL